MIGSFVHGNACAAAVARGALAGEVCVAVAASRAGGRCFNRALPSY